MISFKTVREFAQTMMQDTAPRASVSSVFEIWWKKQPVVYRTLPMKTLAETAFKKAWSLQYSRWKFLRWGWSNFIGARRVSSKEASYTCRCFPLNVGYSDSPKEVLESLRNWLDIRRNDDGDPPHGFYDLAEDFCRWWDGMMKRNFFEKPTSSMRTVALRAFQHGREEKNVIEFGWRTRQLARTGMDRRQPNKKVA